MRRDAAPPHQPGSHSNFVEKQICPATYNTLRSNRDSPHLASSVLLMEPEANMNGNYVFLCGVMWCRYGQKDAGSELMRAAQSDDPDLSALALAMLRKGCRSLPQSKRVN
jgi:hypothetical protein